MVHSRGETLLRSGVDGRGKCGAHTASPDPRPRGAQLGQRPGHILEREPPTLPVRDSVLGAQAIEIDRDIHIRLSQFAGESREVLPPVRAQDRAAPILIRSRTIVRPWTNVEPAFPFRAPVPENLMRPPALEIAAAPDADFLDVRQFERAIHPATAAPARRA